MTYDEAVAVIQVAGWTLKVWCRNTATKAVWHHDVWAKPTGPTLGDYIRNSMASDTEQESRDRFVRWVEMGCPQCAVGWRDRWLLEGEIDAEGGVQ